MLYFILFPLILFPYPIHPSIKLSYVAIAANVHKTVYCKMHILEVLFLSQYVQDTDYSST